MLSVASLWVAPGQAEKRQHAEGVDVASHIGLPEAELFRRGIGARAEARGVGIGPLAPDSGYAQINEHGRRGVGIGDHHIAGRKVAMNDHLARTLVKLTHSFADSGHKPVGEQRSVFRSRTLNNLAKRRALYVLHNDLKSAVLLCTAHDSGKLPEANPGALRLRKLLVRSADASIGGKHLAHIGAQLSPVGTAQVHELGLFHRRPLKHALHAISARRRCDVERIELSCQLIVERIVRRLFHSPHNSLSRGFPRRSDRAPR